MAPVCPGLSMAPIMVRTGPQLQAGTESVVPLDFACDTALSKAVVQPACCSGVAELYRCRAAGSPGTVGATRASGVSTKSCAVLIGICTPTSFWTESGPMY